MLPQILSPLKSLLSSALISTALVSYASADTVVGSIPAEFSVNSGQASYSIPIQVAPGRGGMQPDLSINYTGGGNGVLGVGWSLGGLSSIHRCAANLEQDGFIAGITFSSKDRYCLDGQRLIPVNGTNGGVGTEYKTEIDGYSQIKSYGGAVNNPSYFIAKTKAGQVITFGGGSGNSGKASLIFPQGTTAWGVREINDSTGNNPISYEYFIDENTQYLSELNYSGGRVKLNYEGRADTTLKYFSGVLVRQLNRVNRITTYAGNVLFNQYIPSYTALGTNNSSSIQSIKECTVNDCFNPIEFTSNASSSSGYAPLILNTSATSGSYGSSGWKFAGMHDTNGDGFPDSVWVYGAVNQNNGAGVLVSLSNGDGTYKSAIYYGVAANGNYGAAGWSFAGMYDTNGDGLVDAVWAYGGVNKNDGAKLLVSLSNGNGGYKYAIYSGVAANGNYGSSGWSFAGMRDTNGDGLVDAVWAYGAVNQNNGAGLLVSLANGRGAYKSAIYYGASSSNNYGSPGWSFGGIHDVNGDGLVDGVWVYGAVNGNNGARVAVSLSQSKKTQLQKITESSGNTTELTYNPLTDPTVYTKGTGAQYPVVDLIYPEYVVSSVKTNDGVGGTSTVNYHYEGLKTHVRGRGSYGYAKVTESYPETGKSQETYFNQTAFPLTGNVDRVVEKLNGQVINESQKTFAVAENNGVYTVNLDQSVDKSYELNGELITTVTTAHRDIDAFGNIGTVEVSTSANGINGNNETFTKSTQSQYSNDTANWYLGRLSETTVTHQAPNQADQQRRSRFTYDSHTGLLTSEAVVSIATGLPLTTTSYQYDAYGHKTQVMVTASGETSRTSTTTYNSEGKPTQSCNQLNQCETYTYTPEGWLQSTTGPNGITTSWEYDGFGRKTQEHRADGTQTTISHHFANPSSGASQCGVLATHAYTCSISQTTGSQPAIVQYDSLGRELRKIVTGFDGRLVYSDTEYNGLAQVTRVSRNYFMGDQVYWANSQYDLLGRVTQMDEPAPHGTRNIIKTTYNGLLTTVTSGPEQRQKTTQTNAIGQVIHRGEEEGSYVEYTYTADGNLKTTTVAGDNSTTITLFYDEFGRKIGMDDPDMGVWSYVYNAFGQLISQTDAKGQITTMDYDVLGRMVSRTDAQGTAQAQTSTWTYGDASGSNPAPQGSIGKLLSESITHPDGKGSRKDYYYDSLGRPEEATTIVDPNTPIEQSFSAQTLYDSIGRVSRTIYPGSDNFYTENLYNANGFLEKVRGLRSNSEQYDLSQLTPLVNEAIDLANGYHTQANTLRAIGDLYQTKIDQYQTLINAGTTSGTISSTTDAALNASLYGHASVLNSAINTAHTDAGSFYGHLNNTVVELQTVTDIINTQVQEYDALVEQLTVLAEQTLAAADNSFQYERTLVRGGEVYTQLVNDDQYTNYWQAIDVDASGRISAEVYGNGIVNDYTYNQATGQLQHIHSSLLSIDPLRHLEYQYDAYQNVTSREDHANDIRETYEYDRLDRLTRTDITSATYISTEFNGSQTQDYDVFGNITHKSDVGNYTYGTGIANGAGIHAVIATTPTDGGSAGNAGRSFQYDANGNMISGAGRTVAWSSFNKPTLITKDGKSAEFQYDASRSRYKKTNHKGDTILYVGKLYEQVNKVGDASNNIPASIDEKHYIYANGQLVAEHIVSTTAGVQTRYLHKDALGSVELVTDATANVVDRRSFDAWGKLRNLTWKDNEGINNPLYLTQLPFTNKGYTGHESIQEVDLIHMNGRVYDATLARFMSADPHIQFGTLSQSYSRYSYVLNNPMKYTDPTGYWSWNPVKIVKKAWKKARKAVKKAVTKVWKEANRAVDNVLKAIAKVPALNAIVQAAACTFGGPLGCAAYAARSTYAVTGSLSASFRAGAFAYAGAKVFPADPKPFTLQKAIIIGVSAENKVAGQVLGLIASGQIRSPQAVLGEATKYYASAEVKRFANKNGLSLNEFNVLLGVNSRLGNEIVGGRWKEGGLTITGFTSRDHGVLGVIWDVNDTILGYQGLTDATGMDYIRKGNGGHIEGHSLGAITANNLVANGYAASATVHSLPFGNVAVQNVEARLGNLDIINGGVLGRIFNPTETSTASPSSWNLLKNHDCRVAYGAGC